LHVLCHVDTTGSLAIAPSEKQIVPMGWRSPAALDNTVTRSPCSAAAGGAVWTLKVSVIINRHCVNQAGLRVSRSRGLAVYFFCDVQPDFAQFGRGKVPLL